VKEEPEMATQDTTDKEEEKPITEGWAKPLNTRKFHYFVDKRSLCDRYMYFGDLEADTGKESPDDCKSCRRKLDKRK